MAKERALFHGELGFVGAFRSSVTDPVPNDAPPYEWPLVVFPRTRVAVQVRRGAPERIVGPGSAVLYAIGDRPLVRFIDPVDRCDFVALRPDVYESVTGTSFDAPEFDQRVVPVASRHVMGLRSLVTTLAEASCVEALHVEETLLAAVGDAAKSTRGTGVPAPGGRHAQRVLAGHVLDVVHADASARWTIDDVARTLGASPATLSRAFRMAMGTTIHRYRLDARLAQSLDRLDDDLSRVAAELGFASHSHFTNTFRQRFGVTPQVARARLRGQPGSSTDPWWTAR